MICCERATIVFAQCCRRMCKLLGDIVGVSASRSKHRMMNITRLSSSAARHVAMNRLNETILVAMDEQVTIRFKFDQCRSCARLVEQTLHRIGSSSVRLCSTAMEHPHAPFLPCGQQQTNADTDLPSDLPEIPYSAAAVAVLLYIHIYICTTYDGVAHTCNANNQQPSFL